MRISSIEHAGEENFVLTLAEKRTRRESRSALTVLSGRKLEMIEYFL